MIGGRTTVLGILGDPVAQVRTPALVNAALAARGLSDEAVLVPLHVGAEGLAAVVRALRELRNFGGAVVTMPHKTAMFELLDAPTPAAREVEACNIVRRLSDGRLIGTMLDGDAFVTGLLAAGYAVAGKRILLTGAGGAAGAIAFALARQRPAALAIQNRAAMRAERLVMRLRHAWPELRVEPCRHPDGSFDVVINATSLGMRPQDPLPGCAAALRPGVVAAEVVVAPPITPFLETAKRLGCSTHSGTAMLKAQIGLMIDFMLGHSPALEACC